MTDDLISRQAAIELCDWYEHEFSECDHIIRLITEDLKSFPPAEPERKQGEWAYPYESTKTICVCSVCGHQSGTGYSPYNFCPNCGADMREREYPCYSPPDGSQLFTNADRIRSMTDEELAEYLYYRGNCSEYCYGICAYQHECNDFHSQEFCIEQIVKWLNQDYKGE